MIKTTVDFITQRHVLPNQIPPHYIQLYTRNADVDAYNNLRLDRTAGVMKQYTAIDTEVGNPNALNETNLAPILRLKPFVSCMLTDNVDVENGWTNGTRCTVIDIENDDYVIVRRGDGNTRAIGRITREVFRTRHSRTQIPLVLAFASNIHKVQSLTITDGAAISLTHAFRSSGQFYVACSRVTNAASLKFFGLGPRTTLQMGVNNEILRFLDNLYTAFN